MTRPRKFSVSLTIMAVAAAPEDERNLVFHANCSAFPLLFVSLAVVFYPIQQFLVRGLHSFPAQHFDPFAFF